LYQFSGPDGSNPASTLTLDSQGNLYGTTSAGGPCFPAIGGFGTAFKLTPARQLTTLYGFGCTSDAPAGPSGRIARDASGNLYGAAGGGAFGFGTVY
jgi:uncharacterized repeat protein (TIGR03803 family)